MKRKNSTYENLKSYLIMYDLINELSYPLPDSNLQYKEIDLIAFLTKSDIICQILEENFIEKRVKKIITKLLLSILKGIPDELGLSLKEHLKRLACGKDIKNTLVMPGEDRKE